MSSIAQSVSFFRTDQHQLFENPPSRGTYTTSSCCVGSGGSFTCSFFHSRSTWSPTAQTAYCRKAYGHALHEPNRPFMVEQTFIHCKNLWSLVGSRCDFLLDQFESGGLNLNWHLVPDPKISLQKMKRVGCIPRSYSRACDDCLAHFGNAFQLLLLSLHQCTCLKHVRKLEHSVLAGDKLSCHP